MTMAEHLLAPAEFRNFFTFYKGTPEQVEAVNNLYVAINSADPCLLHDNAEWVRQYREHPKEAATVDNTWAGISFAARVAGAKYPECVAAQWALESAWGKSTSGKNNFFGIKGRGTSCSTWEDYGNGPVNITASFRDFGTIQECITYLVDRWYKDFQGYKGVNRAGSREECARLLKAEGYATDPAYPQKLIHLMDQNA